MTKLVASIVCLLGLPVMVAAEVPPSSTEREAADIEAVRCAEIAFSRSVETGDKDAFAGFLHDDARFVGRTVLRGRDEIVTGWAVFFNEDHPQLIWRPEVVEVLSDVHLALTRGPYLLTSTDETGQRVEHWGLFNSVWRLNDDGDWKIIFDAGHDGSGLISAEYRKLLRDATCVPAVATSP